MDACQCLLSKWYLYNLLIYLKSQIMPNFDAVALGTDAIDVKILVIGKPNFSNKKYANIIPNAISK
jgi:hypothetical protein